MRPAWAEIMQVIHQGNLSGKSSITCLPMIDMNLSDVTCVSSTLKFVSEHAQRHNIANPIVTFDQPFWWKAFNIIQTEQLPWNYWSSHGGIRVERTSGTDICVIRC